MVGAADDPVNPGSPSPDERERGHPPERTGPARFVLEMASDLRIIEAAVAYLADRCRCYDYGGARLDLNFRVSVTEALANAMLYGNRRDPAKRVRVEVSLDRKRVALEVVDQGPGFSPQHVPDPTLPANLERPGGRGIFLIQKLMDEVRYNQRGNAVLLVLHRDDDQRRASGE